MTVIDELEDEKIIAVSQLVRIRDNILNAIAPDGRPYGMAKLTKRERLRQYVDNVRDDPEACKQWVRDRVFEIQQALVGLTPEKIAMVSPWSIAEKMLLDYSAEMERELKTEMRKAGNDEP